MTDNQNLEESYHEITELYDLADALVSTVEDVPAKLRQEHYEEISPLVNQLEDSADVLTEEFIAIAQKQGKQVPTPVRQRVEKALRNIYMQMDAYAQQVEQQKKQAASTVSKIVGPVIEMIKRQVEKVITIFVGFVELSLDRFMQKAELEKLREREAIIDDLMRRSGMAPGKTT